MKGFFKYLFALLPALISTNAFPATNSVKDAVDIIVLFCVAGGSSNTVSVDAKVDGGLSVKKYGVGGEVGVNLTNTQARGLVEGLKGELSKVTGEQATQARECMRPYIDRILNIILGSEPKAQLSPKNDPSKIGFVSSGTRTQDLQNLLNGRNVEWYKTNDNRYFARYSSLLSGMNITTTIYFDFDGIAYNGRHEISSRRKLSTSYRNRGGEATNYGADPSLLCNEKTKEIADFIATNVSSAVQPLIASETRIEPAWGITGEGADYCRYEHATCRSAVSRTTRQAKFLLAGKAVTLSSTLDISSTLTQSGDRWYRTEGQDCSVIVDSML